MGHRFEYLEVRYFSAADGLDEDLGKIKILFYRK